MQKPQLNDYAPFEHNGNNYVHRYNQATCKWDMRCIPSGHWESTDRLSTSPMACVWLHLVPATELQDNKARISTIVTRYEHAARALATLTGNVNKVGHTSGVEGLTPAWVTEDGTKCVVTESVQSGVPSAMTPSRLLGRLLRQAKVIEGVGELSNHAAARGGETTVERMQVIMGDVYVAAVLLGWCPAVLFPAPK